jgi:CSLREA domain-containing protein
VLAALALAGPAAAATITVTSGADELTTNGACSLREAIMNANSTATGSPAPHVDCAPGDTGVIGADTVVIPSGLYVEMTIGGTDDVGLVGDFDIATRMTISGAGVLNSAVSAEGLDRVFHIRAGIPAAQISGLRIENGSVTADGGGGILNEGNLTLTNSLVTDNRASSGATPVLGGGILNLSSLTISGTSVSGNTIIGSGNGGGIGQEDPGVNLTIRNSIVSGNDGGLGGGVYQSGNSSVLVENTAVTANTSISGGGLYLDGDATGTYVLSNLRITDNSASQSGGGLWLEADNGASLSRLTVARNAANPAIGQGGGIRMAQGGTAQITLTNSSVSKNSASGGGGVYSEGGGGPTRIVASTINANTASANGGGIYNVAQGTVEASGLTVLNSTISGNEGSLDSGVGGGIFNTSSGNLALHNTTVANNNTNEADNLYTDAVALTKAKNTILAITSGTSGHCGGAGEVVDQGGNLEGLTSVAPSCAAFPDGYVSLGPLQNNGGPTSTHAVLPTTEPDPIGRGVSCEATDQRGVPRNLGGACESGAYERVLCAGGVVNRVGTQSADRMTGTSASEVFLMLGGNDVLNPGGGTDRACMGAGNDTVSAKDGTRDVLRGEAGSRDRLARRDSVDSFTGFERFG